MKIALTYTGNPDKHLNYARWLKSDDNIEIVKLSAENDNLAELDTCDALVLSGGIDIHPQFYGGKTNYPGAPELFNEKRDQFEISCFQSAQNNNLPVLGICRGMQLINVIQNGTLHQDLTDDVADAHKGDPEKYHTVTIEENTLLREITGVKEGSVNSTHHQAIQHPGENLKVNSIADDGTIEGLEWKEKEGKSFLLGIQWHPERMFQVPSSPLTKKLRDHFILAIKKSAASKNEYR